MHDEPATTNVDNLLQLVDTALNVYKSKHKKKNTNVNNKKVTNLLKTLGDDIKSKTTNQYTSPRLDESHTTNTDNQVTYKELNTKQRNDKTEHATSQNMNINKNLDKTNDDLDTMKLNDDLIKSLNPEGEVIVDNINTNKQNDMTKHEKGNSNTNKKERVEKTDDIMKLDNDLIKLLNPEGQVVVDNSPRKPLLHKKLTKNAKTDQNTNETPQKTNSFSQNTNANTQNTNESPVSTNDNEQNTNDIRQNDNSQKTTLHVDLIKSVDSQGKAVVDDTRQPVMFDEQLAKDSSGVDRHEIQNDLMTNLQTNMTELEENILDDDDTVIKSINPAGGVVVNSNRKGKQK